MNKICMIKQRWQSQKVHGLWEDIHKRDIGQTSTDILVGGCYTYILYTCFTNTWYISECIRILIYKKLTTYD